MVRENRSSSFQSEILQHIISYRRISFNFCLPVESSSGYETSEFSALLRPVKLLGFH